jgi:hypothetical protein
MKNSPDRVAIRFYRWANLDHRGNKHLGQTPKPAQNGRRAGRCVRSSKPD